MIIYTIIVTYNGMQWIDRCLQSLRDSNVKTVPIVIDNGSSDNTIEHISFNYPEVILFPQAKNLGFGGANNIGIRYALEHDCDYVYLLNQDAWIDSSTIKILVEINQQYPKYGILSPLQTNAIKDKLDLSFAEAICVNDTILSDSTLGLFKDVYQVDAVMAAHWLVSKDCLIKVGGFSPVFYHYGEDNDYIHRAVYHNYKVGFVPKVIGVHDREFRKPVLRSDLQLLEARFLHSLSDINKKLYKVVFKTYASLIIRTIKLFVKYRKFSILYKSVSLFISLPRIVGYRRYLKKNIGVYLENNK